MRINHNIGALNTHRQLSGNTAAQSKSIEKLSSGLRINRAGDDAAGLAISEKMRGQIRGLDQAQRNAQDGISMIQTAEGALSETHSILQRMRELSVQSSNDTMTDDDRVEIQKEINQLVDEIDRIGNDTEFNTKKLINGDVAQTKTSTNTDLANGALLVKDTSSATKSGVYAVDVTTEAKQAFVNATGAAGTATAGANVSVNNVQIDFDAGDTVDKMVLKINNQSSATGVEAFIANNGGVSFRSSAYGSDAKITLTYGGNASTALGNTNTSGTGVDVAGTINNQNATGKGKILTLQNEGNAADGLSVEVSGEAKAATAVAAGAFVAPTAADSLSINGVSIIASAVGTETITDYITAINAKTAQTGVTATNNAGKIDLTSTAKGDGVAITIAGTNANTVFGGAPTITAGTDNITNGADNDATVTINNANVLSMHIGANNSQTMNVDINDMRASAIGKSVTNTSNLTSVADLKTKNALESKNSAEDAIKVLDEAIKNVSAERSKLGSFQNRLEHTINNLGTSSENLTAAESRIRDVDMAKEMMEQTKNSILAQAAQAMLAQANQQPQGVLQLLR